MKYLIDLIPAHRWKASPREKFIQRMADGFITGIMIMEKNRMILTSQSTITLFTI